MNKSELEKVGLAIYICEGTKIRRDPRGDRRYSYAIEVTNSDSRIIKVFLRFLREIVGIKEEKLKAQLFVYEDLEEKVLKQYWSKELEIPALQFNKSIALKQRSGRYKPSRYGTLKVRYYDKALRIRLETMLGSLFV